MNKNKTIAGVSLVLALGAPQAIAAVSAEEAARLGQDLTLMGAERSGNADGTIPEWTNKPLASTDVDALLQEKPLFTITAENVEQYKDRLSAGQLVMFNTYPDSYKMNVYPTHRTAVYPKAIYEKGVANATTAKLVEGGNGISDFNGITPFPIPQNGLEVVWNHITRYRGGMLEREVVQLPVARNGAFNPISVYETFLMPYQVEGYELKKDDDNIIFYYTQKIQSPPRLTGNVLLVHETLDQVRQPRQAWKYNAGQRRVRRAPQVAYDSPGSATDGQRTTDQLDMFNGAPDRYEWKLVGKQELYIPYNSFKLASGEHSYKDITRPGHLNPELTSYELHRVWKVEATLKEGARHVYAKRVFYIDEDSWQIAVADLYDGRGQLWRVQEGHQMQYLAPSVPWLAAETNHDLQSGRFLVSGLSNERSESGYNFDFVAKRNTFTPSAIRRAGKR
ncbi:DUF1329 domain-containing protein [Pontibacterium sp.]|uniref:DUF1329 domain-containing protein n=1 Tax=Pontibacterium sp. TaxID=2036026 RepID=UPI0035111C38